MQRLREDPQLPTVIVIDIYIPGDGDLQGGSRLAKRIREELKLQNTRQTLKLLEIPIVVYSDYANAIDDELSTVREYRRVRRKLETQAVFSFIDKNRIRLKDGERF